MKHFTIWEWVDFVSSTAESGLQAAMGTHLAGCAKCQGMVATLTAVADVSRRESLYEPPDHAVRYAQALYEYFDLATATHPTVDTNEDAAPLLY